MLDSIKSLMLLTLQQPRVQLTKPEEIRETCRKTKLLNYSQTASKHVREAAYGTGRIKNMVKKLPLKLRLRGLLTSDEEVIHITFFSPHKIIKKQWQENLLQWMHAPAT